MSGETILPQFFGERKLLAALFMLLSLKTFGKAFIGSSVVILILGAFTALASALCELTSSITQLWQHSDSITRLLLLILAVYCIKRAIPYIAQLHRRGIV